MDRKLKDYLLIALKGVSMGAADTVPGVSGGTIAFITGIYEELITSLGNIDFSLLTTWKKKGFKAMWTQLNGNFLVALLSGVALSIFTLMRLAKYLLETHPLMVWGFFFGLVLASIWYVSKQIKQWRIGTILAMLIGAVLAYWITTFSSLSSDNHGDWYLFISGALAVCAMILPGISGAYILLLLGAYEEITKAVSEFDLQKIIITGLGIGIGLLSFAKVLKWLFSKYEQVTLAALTGFIAGSLNKIWPWKIPLEIKEVDGKEQIISEKSVFPQEFQETMGNPKVLQTLLFFVLGFILILGLEFIAQKMSSSNGRKAKHT